MALHGVGERQRKDDRDSSSGVRSSFPASELTAAWLRPDGRCSLQTGANLPSSGNPPHPRHGDVDAVGRDEEYQSARAPAEQTRVALMRPASEISLPWGQPQSEVLVMAGLARAPAVAFQAAHKGQIEKVLQRAILAMRRSRTRFSGGRKGSSSTGLGAQRLLWWATCCVLISSVGSWIALSNQGYSVKHSLLAQAGVRVTGDVKVNGVVLSRPVADLQCNPSRQGALRWNEDAFEGCDGETDWRPLTFCSRSCDIDEATVPCGIRIRNKCDNDCNQVGTGLNMRQCLLNVADTPCDVAVEDLCGNACGMAGEQGCADSVKAFGDYIIRPTGAVSNPATYTFSVAKAGVRNGEPDDGFYLTYDNSRTRESIDLTRITALDEKEERDSPIRSVPFGDSSGMELSPPDADKGSTVRVSMYTELVGGYIEIGEAFDSEAPSHIFVDGTIEKECPFLFNAGNYDSALFMKVCMEPPQENVSITLPDAGGVVITTGNADHIRSVPGLRGEDSLMYTSSNKDTFHLRPPTAAPRLTCSSVQCIGSPLVDVNQAELAGCNAINYERQGMDLFRILYGLVNVSDPNAHFTAADVTRELLRNATQPPRMVAEGFSTNISSTNMSSTNMSSTNFSQPSLLQLANLFAQSEITAAGNESIFLDPLLLLWTGRYDLFAHTHEVGNTNWTNWTNTSLADFAADYLRQREECFACCCFNFSAPSGKQLPYRADPGGLDIADLGRCPAPRHRLPTFCLSGELIGASCQHNADCLFGACGYHEDVVTCFEEDLGYRCQVVWDRTNFSTTMHFAEPSGYRRLHIPDASGGIISTGNLEDITSLGVQVAPVVGRSGPNTTTTIAFAPPAGMGLQQRSSRVMNNTLLIPNEADGVLLSTGNLEDVTLASGSITGLRITEDLHVRGRLVFGDDVTSSGFFLPPVPSSTQYTTPHSGRPSSRGRPGQLSFAVDESTTVLEFEPSDAINGVNSSQVTVPATNGTVITTGNLEAVTAQSGIVTSFDVMELSYLQGGVVAGVKGDAQVVLQGRASRTITFNASHPRGRGEQGFSHTVVGFEMTPGSNARIQLPAASGVAISTGNLPDIFAFTGDSVDVAGRSLLNGPVSIGSRSNSDYPTTPIKVGGYLTGDIVYRDVPAESSNLVRVPFPNTWEVYSSSVCSGNTFAGNTDPQTTVPFQRMSVSGSAQYYERALSVPDGKAPFGTGCRELCQTTPNCGALVASKYFRVTLMSEQAALEESERVVGVSIPAPRVEDGVVVGDETCYPGYASNPANFTSDFLHNFSAYPASRIAFLQNPACQAVVSVQKELFEPMWEREWFQLGQLEMRLVGCRPAEGETCVDLGECSRPDADCNVTIRSHAVGSFLTGSNASRCLGEGAGVGCARWASAPVMWNLEPYAGGLDLRWHEMGTEEARAHYYRLRRMAACVEVIPALTTSEEVYDELTCGEGDMLKDLMIKWGSITGTCGGYGADGGVECVGPDQELMESLCLAHGCDLRIHGRQLFVRAKRGDGLWHMQTLRQCVSGQRLVIQSSCQATPYLTSQPQSAGSNLKMVAAESVSEDHLSSVFHLHSRIFLYNGEEQILRGGYLRDCWVTEMAPQECNPVERSWSTEYDVHLFAKYTATTLAFANMSSEQEQAFPDATGTIISSGNLRDVTKLPGLQGQDTLIYQHSHQAGGPVTIVDFAAVGHAPRGRVEGLLPDYVREDGSAGHEVPEGGNRRITFPDATGTVITTGNLDDLVFQRLELNGLTLDGTANFFNELGQTAVLNFKNGSRISGCLNFNQQPTRNEITGELDLDPFYTQICIEEPTGQNKINLPDASGTILTTGNLLNLPTVGVQGEFFVGGDATIEGDMTWGREGVDAVVQQFSWIDGDVGLTFAAPQSALNEGFDVVKLNMPHMGGVDIAIRHYITYDVRELAVDVQGGEAYLLPVPGSERINETVCERLMADNRVFDYHGLGYFLLQHELIAKTLIRDGVPYWGVESQGNQTYPACVFLETGDIVCEGPQPDPCSCTNSDREAMMVKWRPMGVQTVLGEHNGSSCANVACDDSPFTCPSPADPGCAFDGDLSTVFRSQQESLVSHVPHVAVEPAVRNFEAYGTNLRNFSLPPEGQCVLGLRLAAPTEITRVRVFPASGMAEAMSGGKIQGSTDAAGASWVDVLQFTVAPREEEWNEIVVRELEGVRFRAVRYVGPGCQAGAECRCDVAEWEFHTGRITQRFTALEAGTRSHYIVPEAVNNHPQGAMVLKCAAQHWFPAYQTMHVNELMLPEASGILLTTGNLQDVTKEVGTISSLQVAGEAQIRGSTVLGSDKEETLLKIEAVTKGRTPLSFAGGGIVDAAAFFSVPDASADRTIHFPPESGGSIVTTGSLPLLTEHMSVVGESSLRGNVLMDSSVTIGDKLFPSNLQVNSALSSSFPMTFRPGSAKANEKTTLGVENPSEPRSLNLPDVEGTIVTTGNLPDVIEGATFVGDTVFKGGAKFEGGDFAFGRPDARINLEINSAIAGSQPLKFEGRSTDERTLSLAVEEPSAQNILFLPDVSGTIITTGNFPDVVENLEVLGDLVLEGDASIVGSSTVIGHCELKSQLSVHSYLRGRYPLVFSPVGGDGSDDAFLSTTFEITPPTGDNVIAFPDASGTVITTGNVPTAISVDFEYSINVGRFLGISSSVTMGRGAAEPKHSGSFVFADGSTSTSGSFSSTKDNSFNVRATGGVRFVTGYTQSGRELGVVLEPGSSAWSVLSDERSKTVLAPLDHVATLRTLVEDVPISTWTYEGHDVRHMGPMAQDVFAAFGAGESPQRISTVDMDGIALSAAKGMDLLVDDAARRLEDALHLVDVAQHSAAAPMPLASELDAMLEHNALLLERLERLLAAGV